MTTSTTPDEMWPDTRRPSPPRRTARRVAAGIGLALGVVVMFFGITTFTGFPGPGPLRRYPIDDLNRLADEVNAQRGVGQRRQASVDLVRSRVRVRGAAAWGCSDAPISSDDWPMMDLDPRSGYTSCPVMP